MPLPLDRYKKGPQDRSSAEFQPLWPCFCPPILLLVGWFCARDEETRAREEAEADVDAEEAMV